MSRRRHEQAMGMPAWPSYSAARMNGQRIARNAAALLASQPITEWGEWTMADPDDEVA